MIAATHFGADPASTYLALTIQELEQRDPALAKRICAYASTATGNARRLASKIRSLEKANWSPREILSLLQATGERQKANALKNERTLTCYPEEHRDLIKRAFQLTTNLVVAAFRSPADGLRRVRMTEISHAHRLSHTLKHVTDPEARQFLEALSSTLKRGR